MTEVDDFLYVLVAGIVIVVVALVIFALVPPGGIGITTQIENFTLGAVGFAGDNMQALNLGTFTVGEVNTETIKRVPQIQVSSSYFGARADREEVRVLNAYLPSVREARIWFTVYDSTPAYGRLIIKWNGAELYNTGASRGVYSLRVDPSLIKETNNLEISCDGPGVYFWASTVYMLRDFRVELDYGSVRFIPFTLSSKDMETFKNGALEFGTGYGGAGTLTIKINGAQVFSGKPGPSESVKFDMFNSPVQPGNNMIAFSVQGGSYRLENAVLKIFLSTDQFVKERTVRIPKEKYDLFLQGYRGRLEFEVLAIRRAGSLSIQMNGKELNVPSVQAGTNTVLFSGTEAKEGDNILRFSGTGGWEIGDVSILMER